MRFSETVNRVADLATRIQDYWDVELRKRHPNYPLIGDEGEDDGPPPPEEAELRDLLRSLSPEDLDKLTALVDLGRGEYPASHFRKRCREIADQRPVVEEVISTLVGHPFLAADLTDGLKVLSTVGIDVDVVQPLPV